MALTMWQSLELHRGIGHQPAQRLLSRALESDMHGHSGHHSDFNFLLGFCGASEGGENRRSQEGGKGFAGAPRVLSDLTVNASLRSHSLLSVFSKRRKGSMCPREHEICTLGSKAEGPSHWPRSSGTHPRDWLFLTTPWPSAQMGILSADWHHLLTRLLARFPSRDGWLSLHMGSVSKLPQLDTCLCHCPWPWPVPTFLGRTGSSGMAETVCQMSWARAMTPAPPKGRRGWWVEHKGPRGTGAKARVSVEGTKYLRLVRWLSCIESPVRKNTCSQTSVHIRYC